MPSMFVRGNMLSVVNVDVHSLSNKGLQTGDTLRVGARKKGGWLVVKCSRTGKVISIRSGPHLCLTSNLASNLAACARALAVACEGRRVLERQKNLDDQLLQETQKQNAELRDEISVLRDKLHRTEVEFAEWRADTGRIVQTAQRFCANW